MRHALATFGLAILVASTLGAGASFAQMGYTPSSIEWLTASSDVIVRATITDLSFADREPEVAGTRSEWQHVTVKLKVLSTLKGKAPATITFVWDQPRGAETLPKWKESAQPVLWFLVQKAREGKKPEGKPRLRGDRLIATSSVELGSAKTKRKVPCPILTIDLRALDSEDAIFDAIKAEVARRGQGRERRSGRIPISREVAQLTGRAGDVNELTVPAWASPIRIEIAADKKEYPFRGAIRLTVTYTNTSKEAVELVGNGTVGDWGIDGETFEVTSGAGRKAYTIHAVEPATWKKTIEPGKSWKRDLDLTAVLSNTTVDEKVPGKGRLPDPFGRLDEYTIRLSRQSTVLKQSKLAFEGPVESNLVKFSVRR